MAELGPPHKNTRLTRVCVEGSRCRIKVGSNMSDVFRVSTSLKQGDALSPTLFNIALKKVVRHSKVQTKLFQTNGLQLILAYADDIDLVETSESASGVYRIPCSCGSVYVGTSKGSVNTRIVEHKRSCRLGQTKKSAVAVVLSRGHFDRYVIAFDNVHRRCVQNVRKKFH